MSDKAENKPNGKIEIFEWVTIVGMLVFLHYWV
jgi:hypothetical protein